MLKRILTWLFFGLIGLFASLFLAVLFYWSLSLNSSIGTLINSTKSQPLYLWSYALLTIGTILLFGANVTIFIYRWRKFGRPKLRGQAGSGLGALVGIFASACPVCGSLLLSLIGIAGGLAVFPLQGLELKALSFGLMVLSLWLMLRGNRAGKGKGSKSCPVPRDPSFRWFDVIWLANIALLTVLFGLLGWSMLLRDPIVASRAVVNSIPNSLYNEVAEKVRPSQGFKSKIYLGDSVVKLVSEGVINKSKFEKLYQNRGGLPSELTHVLDQPTDTPVTLTRQNSLIYVNLLWPLGLSNYASINKTSPVNGKSLFNFASTGGWTLGKAKNGGTYFNKLKIVSLTSQQETLVEKVAKNTYRPCCNNSTFFQDCNHGSALLGLLELGASQGLSEDELYKEALVFNSFWFPNNYIQTALYYKVVKGADWDKVDPKTVLSFDYSGVSGWNKNVQGEIAKLPGLIPPSGSGGGCGT